MYVNSALINYLLTLIFLNNSWNHSTDKSKSIIVFRLIRNYVYLSPNAAKVWIME